MDLISNEIEKSKKIITSSNKLGNIQKSNPKTRNIINMTYLKIISPIYLNKD